MRLHSISTKLLGATIFALGLAGLASLLPIRAARITDQHFATVFADRVVPLHQLGTILHHVNSTGLPGETPVSRRTAVDSIWRSYLSTYLTPEEKAMADSLRPSMESWLAGMRDAASGQPEAAARIDALKPRIASAMRALMDLQVRVARAEMENAHATDTKAVRAAIALLVLSLLTGTVVSVFVSRSLTRGLASIQRRANSLSAHCIAGLTNGLQSLARGDATIAVEPKTTPIEWNRRDELGDLALAVNAMIVDLQSAVSSYNETRLTVRALADDVHHVGAEILEGNADTRMNSRKFDGAFHEAANAVNGALDGVLGPMSAAMEQLQVGVEHLSKGDLTVRLDPSRSGHHAPLLRAFSSAVSQLETTIASVREAAAEVKSASNEIADAADEGALNASRQASRLEDVANGTSTLRADATRISQEADLGRQRTLAVSDATTSGLAELQTLADALQTMRSRADATSRVVKAIDEIAFQTNLLALNAAVEAARAGDAGRGFAVVAEEVRGLALRAAESARQAASLIEENVQAVGQGVAAGDRAVQGIAAIESHVSDLSQIMETVTERCAEQMQHVSTIAGAVEQLNTATQSTAASAEQSAAASEELRSQSATLDELVKVFTVRNARVSTARRAA